MLGTETTQMEDMTVKASKLMAIFEQDSEQFSNELQSNIRTLCEFQQHFDAMEDNFDEI